MEKHNISTSSSIRFDDNSSRERAWANIAQIDGYAFDFIGSSAVLEWLQKEGAIDMADSWNGRFGRYRRFSQLTDIAPAIGQFVLFDKIYLNIGTFYRDNMDLASLARHGLFAEFPRPYSERFHQSYTLLRPLAARTLGSMIHRVLNVSYSDIWKPHATDVRDSLGGFEGLAAWFYDEFAKDACGLPCNDGALMASIRKEFFFKIVDLAEYATDGQGHFGQSAVSFFSSIIRPGAHAVSQQDITDEMAQRHDLFALYQVATGHALGFAPTLSSFTDVLRLREDKRVAKIRRLLVQYRHAVASDDQEIVEEIEGAIRAAHKEASALKFSERPLYILVMKALSRVPLLGSIVGLVGDSVDLVQLYRKRKTGWIYFGIQ